MAAFLGEFKPVVQAKFILRMDRAPAAAGAQHFFQSLIVFDQQIAGG